MIGIILHDCGGMASGLRQYYVVQPLQACRQTTDRATLMTATLHQNGKRAVVDEIALTTPRSSVTVATVPLPGTR